MPATMKTLDPVMMEGYYKQKAAVKMLNKKSRLKKKKKMKDKDVPVEQLPNDKERR